MNPDKVALRAAVLGRRAEMSPLALASASAAVGRHIATKVHASAATRISAYLPVGAEPGSIPALDELRRSGVEVLLPVLLGDFDLDWAMYDGPDALVGTPRGLMEPLGTRLGRDAVATAQIVLVPALAVDPAGHRLGRGGGSYDRALARLGPDASSVALLHDVELIASVPHEEHDRPVTHTITPGHGCRPLNDG
ncbi:MAG: 5-formyltetrahydrofolate cyclo-ligase [Mycobacteriales bacterium]